MSSTRILDSVSISQFNELKEALYEMREDFSALRDDNKILQKQNKELLEKVIGLEKTHENLQNEVKDSKKQIRVLESKLSIYEVLKRKRSCFQYESSQVVKKMKTNVTETSFESLNDDNLYDILKFTGEKSYVLFGLLNKRCNRIFQVHGIPKKSQLCGYAGLNTIIQKYLQGKDTTQRKNNLAHGIVEYNRMDVVKWASLRLHDKYLLQQICIMAIFKHRLDILEKVFSNSNRDVLHFLRHDPERTLCLHAALYGSLDAMKWLRMHGCGFDVIVYLTAKDGEHYHICEWLCANGCAFRDYSSSEGTASSDSDDELSSDTSNYDSDSDDDSDDSDDSDTRSLGDEPESEFEM